MTDDSFHGKFLSFLSFRPSDDWRLVSLDLTAPGRNGSGVPTSSTSRATWLILTEVSTPSCSIIKY